MRDLNIEIGKRIAEELARKGVLQKDLAKELGLSETAVSRYISGDRELKIGTFLEIVKILGVSSDYILDLQEVVMGFKEHDCVRTLVEKDGYPAFSQGVIVSFYGDSGFCEVEIFDDDGDTVDVVTYNLSELEKGAVAKVP